MKLKKILSILLSILMITSSFSATGFSAYADDLTTGSCGENVTYLFDSSTGTLTLSGTGPMNSYAYQQSPFYNNSTINNLVIEEGVTGLCQYSFASCSNLQSVTIPSTMNSIGYGSFIWTTSLTSIVVANDNTVFDSRNNCNAIIKTADNRLMIGCKATVIPNTVTRIADAAFYGCNQLTSITIPNSVTRLEALSFYRCEALESITIPDSVTEIDGGAFLGCKKINHFVIPDSVTTIGADAFSAYTSSDRDSDSIRFDSNDYILPVARSVLYKNKLYIRFDKPISKYSGIFSSYIKFAEGATDSTWNLIQSMSKNGPKKYYIVGGKLTNNEWKWIYSNETINLDGKWNTGEPSGNETYLSFASANGLCNDINHSSETPGFIACIDLDAINSQTFSTGYYKTNKYVFYNNPMPFGVAKLIAEANGGYLTTITSEGEQNVVHNTVGTSKKAFIGGEKNTSNNFVWLTDENLGYTHWGSNEPSNESSVGGQYFMAMFASSNWDDCNDLTSSKAYETNGFVVEYAPTNVEIVYTETDTTTVNDDEITLKATYPDGTSANIETDSISITKKNNISYNVTVNYKNEKGELFSLSKFVQLNETGKCGDDAYYSYDGSTGTLTITGTGNIYDFSNGASAHFANFYTDVKTVIIEDGITSIGNNTFNGCTALNEVSLPDTLASIRSEAFSSCSSLQGITLPDSVTEIKQYAFYKCDALKNIVLPKAIKAIGKSAFLSCSALESVTISFYNAEIFDSQSTIPPQAIIKGCLDSAAQLYAQKYNRTFVAFEHEFEETNVASTCTQTGGTVHTCTLCDYSYKDNEIPLLEHNYEQTVIESTCTECGYNVYTCADCGYEYSEELSLIPHNWSEGETTKEPSCEEDGEKTYTCSSCGQTRTEVINATGHNYSESSSTQATCTENGSIVYACENCGNEYSQVVEATGHCYQTNTVLPTCTQRGYTEYLCSVCGESFTSDYVQALGHQYGAYTFNNDVTEYFDGSETATCTVCGESDTRNIGAFTAYSENINAVPGEVISIPVYIKNNTGLAGFGFEFEYESSVLTPVSVTNGALVQSGLNDNLDGDAVQGKFKVIWYGTDSIDQNGILLNLNFAVKDNAPTGIYVVNINCINDDTFDEDYNNVEPVCNDFIINIENANEPTRYHSKLITSSDDVTAGDVFYISSDDGDSNAEITHAKYKIEYEPSLFTLIGYADMHQHIIQSGAVENTGLIEFTAEDGKIVDSNIPDNTSYFVFKANEYAKSGEYEIGYSVYDVADIDEVSAEGCKVKINPSATSELANIYIEDGISAEYNDTVIVPVHITNNKGVMGYMINIEYNPEQLEAVTAQRGSSFPGNFNDTIGVDDEGTFSILWNGTDNVANDGVLMNLMFRVLTDEYVISPITITYSQDDTFNSDYDDVVFNCISGSIHLNEEESHQFIDEVVAPTPNSKGYTKHTCTNCGYSYTDNETDYANDMSALEAALEKVTGYDSADYSTSSYQQLQSVYSSYLDYPNRSIPQTTIDNATSEILTAISNLVPYLYLTVTGENGTVSVSGYEQADKYSVLFGETITLTATADEGYVFDGWYETVTKRIRSNDETFSFKITSNTDFEARFIKEQSATLTFANDSGWVAGKVSKTISEWVEVTTIEDLLPNVPYKLGFTNGRWVYNNATVIHKLQNGENVTIIPEYDETDYENPVIPTPLGGEPALDLYYQLDEDNNIGSFTMAAGFPENCQVESIGVAFYYKKASTFNPTDFDLNINNKMITSKFEASNEDGIYTVDVKKFTSYYNWSARGYVTYYDKDGNLKVAYSNQINIIDREQIG